MHYRKEESYQTTTSQSSFDASNFRSSSFQFTTDDGTSDEDENENDPRYLPFIYEDQEEGDNLTTFGRYACQRPSNWNPYNREIIALFEFLEHARELQGKEYKRKGDIMLDHLTSQHQHRRYDECSKLQDCSVRK